MRFSFYINGKKLMVKINGKMALIERILRDIKCAPLSYSKRGEQRGARTAQRGKRGYHPAGGAQT